MLSSSLLQPIPFNLMIILIILLILIDSMPFTASNRCGHDNIPHEIYRNEHIKPYAMDRESRRQLLNDDEEFIIDAEFDSFRIAFDAHQLVIDFANKSFGNYFANEVIPAAVDYIQRIIRVRPVVGNLTFEWPCTQWADEAQGICKSARASVNRHCGSVPIDADMFGELILCPHFTGATTETATNTTTTELPVFVADNQNDNGATAAAAAAAQTPAASDSVSSSGTDSGAESAPTYDLSECTITPSGAGVAADILVYFTGTRARQCSGVYGYSSYCLSNHYDRPLAGFVNICEETLASEGPLFTWEKAVTLVVHEFFHVLGFSSMGFRYFRKHDATRSPRTERNPLTGHPIYDRLDPGTVQTHTIRGKSATFITLPTVVEKAKEFYRCGEGYDGGDAGDFIGVELEDFGGADTASSHWEQRILVADFMIGYIAAAAPLTVFTFALLQDSGWYDMRWEYASESPFARHAGCKWFDDTCIIEADNSGVEFESLLKTEQELFCVEDVKYGCAPDHVAKSNCELKEYTSAVPSAFQYFGSDKTTVAGVLEYADYCPMYYSYSNGDCRIPESSHVYENFGGTVCPGCKCTTLVKKDSQYAICYEHRCFKNSDNEYVGVRMKVRDSENNRQHEWITCWSFESQNNMALPTKSTSLYSYAVKCPVVQDICYDANPWMCNGHGLYARSTIDDGLCKCNAGYFGCKCDLRQNSTNQNNDANQDYLDDSVCTAIIEDKFSLMSDNAYCIESEIAKGLEKRDAIADKTYKEYGGHLRMTFLNHYESNKNVNSSLCNFVHALKLWIAVPIKISSDNVWLNEISVDAAGSQTMYDMQFLANNTLEMDEDDRPSSVELHEDMHSVFQHLFPGFVSGLIIADGSEHETIYALETVKYPSSAGTHQPPTYWQFMLVFCCILHCCNFFATS